MNVAYVPVASHHDSYTYPQPTPFTSTRSFPLPPIHTCYYPIPSGSTTHHIFKTHYYLFVRSFKHAI